MNDWRAWGMKNCPPPITCDADMREHIGNKAESADWFQQQHARSQEKLFKARDGWDKALERLRAQASEREALLDRLRLLAVRWVDVATGHRSDGEGLKWTLVAEAHERHADELLDALRSGDTKDSRPASVTRAEDGSLSDVAPVVENTGHLSPVATAAEGEPCGYCGATRCICGNRDMSDASRLAIDQVIEAAKARLAAEPPPAPPPASDAGGERRFRAGQRVRRISNGKEFFVAASEVDDLNARPDAFERADEPNPCPAESLHGTIATGFACPECGYRSPSPPLPGELGQVEALLTRAELVAALAKLVNRGGIIKADSPGSWFAKLAEELARKTGGAKS